MAAHSIYVYLNNFVLQCAHADLFELMFMLYYIYVHIVCVVYVFECVSVCVCARISSVCLFMHIFYKHIFGPHFN